jgi:hypothetical protein
LTRTITPERLLEENEALRQIIREALPYVEDDKAVPFGEIDQFGALLERMRAAIGDEKA